MLKPAKLSAFLLILAAACPFGACVADTTDDEPGTVAEPITAGLCEKACLLAAEGFCDWPSQCDPTWGGEREGGTHAVCGPKVLTCEAAEHASNGTAWELSWCWRECEGLH